MGTAAQETQDRAAAAEPKYPDGSSSVLPCLHWPDGLTSSALARRGKAAHSQNAVLIS